MPTNFPGAVDNLSNPAPTDSLNTPGVLHSDQHTNANDAIEAIEARILNSVVAAVSTSNIASLSGTPVVDGYQTVAGNHVLLTAQTTASQNGPWIVASGAWSRPADFPAAATLGPRSITVTGGTRAGSVWVLNTTTTVVVGSSAQTWVNTPVQAGTYAKYVTGLAGDGTTDDRAVLNAALAAGGYVRLPPGKVFAVTGELTIAVDGTTLDMSGSTIKAKDSTNFQNVITGSGRANVTVRNGTVDGNQAGRIGVLTTVCTGIFLTSFTDSRVESVTVKNVTGAGATGSGNGIAFGGISTRCVVADSTVMDCPECDGIYTSGIQNLTTGCIAKSCGDTGFVIASSSYSGIAGCTSLSTPSGAAIANTTATDHRDNYIVGLSISDWGPATSGGIQLGIPTATAGHLLNTKVSDVTMSRTTGTGPAINCLQGGTGRTKGLIVSNVRSEGSTTQGILLNGVDDGLIIGCSIAGTPAPVQIQNGCARVVVVDNILKPAGTSSIGVQVLTGCNDVHVGSNVIAGDGTATTYGVFFYGTSTGGSVVLNKVTGHITAKVGSDAGTTLGSIVSVGTSGALELGKTNVPLYYDDAFSVVRIDGGFMPNGKLQHNGTTVGFNQVTPVGKRTLGAAATDAASTQTLANNLRQALIDVGLGQT